MSLYWRNHPDLQTVELPQTIMRPFWHPEALQLDDEKFCMSLIQRPVISSMVALTVSILLLIIAGFGFYEIYLAFNLAGAIEEQRYPELAISSGLVIAALIGFYIFARINQPRFICFDRKNHSIHFTSLDIIARPKDVPYDQLQGIIMHKKSLLGRRMSILALIDSQNKKAVPLANTQDNPQILAGFWSFVVQYMKKGAPLPDVPALHDYPNTTPGVLHQNTIDYS